MKAKRIIFIVNLGGGYKMGTYEGYNVPNCHGEPMQPTFRYLGSKGKIMVTYRCMFCGNKEEVEI